MRALNLDAVERSTPEAMTENVAFYPRLGFVEVNRRIDHGFRRVYFRNTPGYANVCSS